MYFTTQADNPAPSLLDISPGNPTKALSLSDINNMVEMANKRAGNYNVNPGTLSEVEEQQLKRARKKYMFNFPGKELPLQLANVDAYRNFQMAQLPDPTGPDPYMGGHMNPRSPGDYALVPEGGIGGGGMAGLSDEKGYSIPSPEATPAQLMAMNEQMVPGFQQYFGGGHPDEISLAQAPKHYGYDQFTKKPPGLLEPTPTPAPIASQQTNDRSGWDRDKRWRDASNRDKDWQELLGMGLLNMSNNMMRENTF